MTQNLLDDFVGDAETMKIRSQPAPKRVPAMPRNLLGFQRRPDHFSRQRIQIQGLPAGISKNISLRWMARMNSVPVEKKFQLCNHRDGSFALFSLRLAYVISPYRLLYLYGVAVVAFPKKATDFALASTRERRHGDNRCGGFRKNSQHLNFFLERIGMSFTRRTRSGNLHFVHGVRSIEHTLSPGITKYATEKVFDVAER
jgi:hypothetical protein